MYHFPSLSQGAGVAAVVVVYAGKGGPATYEENQTLRALSRGIDEIAEVGNANGYIGNLRPRVSEALVP